MKKVLYIILLLSFILIPVGCNKKNNKVENTDALKFKEEYESLNGKDNLIEVSIKENNPMIYSDIDEVVDIMNNKSGLIYFGNAKSNGCRDMISILIEAAKQTGLKQIYYIDVNNIDENDEKISRVKEYITDFDGASLLFVKDKENIGSIQSLDKDYKKMTEEEQDELLKIYRNSIHEILDDICDQSC